MVNDPKLIEIVSLETDRVVGTIDATPSYGTPLWERAMLDAKTRAGEGCYVRGPDDDGYEGKPVAP